MLKYIYLTSSGYSGSTLLSFILNAHPRIASIGELSNSIEKEDPESYSCSCGQLIKDCLFWKTVTDEMDHTSYSDFDYRNFKTKITPKEDNLLGKMQFMNFNSNFLSDIRDYLFKNIPEYQNHITKIVQNNIDLAKTILKITKKDIFFDASKDPRAIKYFRNTFGCEFKVIHLIKDGRGFLYSAKRYNPRRSDLNIILSWKKMNELMDRSIKYVKKENRFILTYKQLSKNPAETLSKLCKFVGVDYIESCLDYRNFDHHIIGNSNMRLGSDNQIKYDEKWREGLTSSQIMLFEDVAGKLNRKYGYTD